MRPPVAGPLRVCGWVLSGVLGLWALPAGAASKVTIAVVSLDGDARHVARRMERAYPGHPTGRAIDGVQLAAEDSAFELDAAGLALEVKDVVLPNAAALPKALAELKAAIARNESDIAGIRRELGRVPASNAPLAAVK